MSSKKVLTLPAMVECEFLGRFYHQSGSHLSLAWSGCDPVVFWNTRGFHFPHKVFRYCSFYPGQRSFSREFVFTVFIILLIVCNDPFFFKRL